MNKPLHRPGARSLRRYPTPEPTVLERILSRIKQQMGDFTGPWQTAAVGAFGQLQKHRRRVRSGTPLTPLC